MSYFVLLSSMLFDRSVEKLLTANSRRTEEVVLMQLRDLPLLFRGVWVVDGYSTPPRRDYVERVAGFALLFVRAGTFGSRWDGVCGMINAGAKSSRKGEKMSTVRN